MTEPSDTKEAKQRRPLKRVLRVVIILVLVASVAVALMPTILSTDGFRNSMVSEANRNLGGTVEIDDLSLGWTGTQSIAGLTLWPGEPGETEPLFELPSASFNLEILPLLSGNVAIESEVTDFKLRLVVHEDGSTSLEDFLGRSLRNATPEEVADTVGGKVGERLPRRVELDLPGLAADVRLTNGLALLVDERLGITTGVENLTITATSKRYSDPLVIDVTADLRVGEVRSPFTMRLSALGEDDAWDLSLKTEGLQPGSLTTPLLAAAFPLLAGDSGSPVNISAPMDLDLNLGGSSLEDLLAGALDSLTGNVVINLQEGGISGGLFGKLQDALGMAGAGGIELPSGLASMGDALSLEFHGFAGTLAIADGRVTVNNASLRNARGESRPLPIEGYASLDGTLHYKIPWTALVSSAKAAKYLEDRYLSIEGPFAAPTYDMGLSDLVEGALKNELDNKLGEAQEELKDKLGDKLGDELKDKLGSLFKKKP
jgi:uncharacterized protein involved in outer membrane biogenesis